MKEKDELWDYLLQELIEYALKEHRENNMPEEEVADRKELYRLGEEVDEFLKTLPEEKRDLIDNYISSIRSVDKCDYKTLYTQGIQDGIEMLKGFGLL